VGGKDLVKLTEALGLLRRNVGVLHRGFPKRAFEDDSDLHSYLPINESTEWAKNQKEWEGKTKDITLTLQEVKNGE
jgi:hypothetical protein